MRDRARDWSEQGRRPRGEWGRGKRKERVPSFLRPSSPFSARLCLSLAPVSQLLWTRKERDCVQSISRSVSPPIGLVHLLYIIMSFLSWLSHQLLQLWDRIVAHDSLELLPGKRVTLLSKMLSCTFTFSPDSFPFPSSSCWYKNPARRFLFVLLCWPGWFSFLPSFGDGDLVISSQ